MNWNFINRCYFTDKCSYKSNSISCKIKNEFFVYKEFVDENKSKNNGYLTRAAVEKNTVCMLGIKVFIDGES